MRPLATVVIGVSANWETTASCLASLQPTLAPGDDVIVVGHDMTPHIRAQLDKFAGLLLLESERGDDSAARYQRGVDAARTDVVVLLEDDTLVSNGWLDRLVEPLANPNVGATGPRSNTAAGPQNVSPIGYDLADAATFTRWTERWCDDHQGQRDTTVVLDGTCLAARKEAVETVGGITDDLSELSYRLNEAGWTVVIVHDAFVHSLATTPRPPIADRFGSLRPGDGEVLLSAALIVRNEEINLPSCLDALTGLVDEVVVYDTGSTDRTMALAREAGATVVEGYWDDDFARARNAAMDHCHGRWVLSVDADEIAGANQLLVRHILSSPLPFDAMSIKIVNLAGTASHSRPGLSHMMFRVLRRSRCEWEHRLHEQPRALEGQPVVRRGFLQGLELLHSGYLSDVSAAMGKEERNLRVALQDVPDDAEDDEADPSAAALKWINLGRSYTLANQPVEGLACFERARGYESNIVCQKVTLRCGAECLIALERLDEADEWLSALQSLSGSGESMTAYLSATLALRRNDPSAALAALDGVEDVVTGEGINYGDSLANTARAAAYFSQGRWDMTVDSLLKAATRSGEPQWAALLTAMHNAGAEVALLANLVEERQLEVAAASLVTVDPTTVDAFLEALWGRFDAHPAMLAAIAFAAPGLSVSRAAHWSARLRAHGMAVLCPLAAIVDAGSRAPLDRWRAIVVLTDLFGERPYEGIVSAVAASLAEADFATALTETSDMCLELLPALAAGAASSRARAVSMAGTLTELGAGEAAGLVLEGTFGHADLDQARRQLLTVS
jgi:tetratricopeptide (TPR) repeat protein